MSTCTFNASRVQDIHPIWSYTYPNDSTIFCLQAFDNECNATFTGDSDIGGYGVVISFIAISGITTVVATLNAYTVAAPLQESLTSFVLAEEPRPLSRRLDNENAPLWRFWAYKFTNALLFFLCDLQLVTGLGITIAGLAQIETISMYHLNLVFNYWQLTFNSLWAGQSLVSFVTGGGSLANTESEHAVILSTLRWMVDRPTLQRVFVIVATGIGIHLQLVYAVRAQFEWDPLVSGRCLHDSDRSTEASNWFFLAGLFIYEIGVIANLHPRSRSWVNGLDFWLQEVEYRSMSTCRSLLDILTCDRLRKKQSTRDLPAVSSTTQTVQHGHVPRLTHSRPKRNLKYPLLFYLPFCFLLTLTWCLRQFLAVFAIGTGTPTLTTLFYIAFFGWNAGEVIRTKTSNERLVTDESKWGFGQVLPLVLLASVLFYMIDAGEVATRECMLREKESNRKGRQTGAMVVTRGESGNRQHEREDRKHEVDGADRSNRRSLGSGSVVGYGELTRTSRYGRSAVVTQKKFARPFLGLPLHRAAQKELERAESESTMLT